MKIRRALSLFGATLIQSGLLLTTATAAVPSKELTAARAAHAAAERKVSENGTAFRSINEQSTQIRKVLQPNLAKQAEALQILKGNVTEVVNSDEKRADIAKLFKAFEVGGAVVTAGTGGVGAFLKKGAEDAAQNLAVSAAWGDDPMGLKLQGATNMAVDMFTKQQGVKGNLEALAVLLAKSPQEVIASAPSDPSWVSSIFIFTDSDTRALQAHNERVMQLVELCIADVQVLQEKHGRTLESNDRAYAELTAKQFEYQEEQSRAKEALDKLETEEKPKIAEVVTPAIVAAKPPPPPPPPLPEPPPPQPEKTPLEIYTEYYQTGIGELGYYLPGYISAAKALEAKIRSMYAEVTFVLDVGGVVGGGFSLDYLQALQLPEPAAAALDPGTKEPETLDRLADRHRRFLPAATFYTESGVANAINSAQTILDRIQSATVALHAERNKIWSLQPYAEGMDAFYQTLGLGSTPPSDLSVVRAFQNWPGIDIAGSGAGPTLDTLAGSAVDLEYNGGRAPVLIRKLKGGVAAIESAFAKRVETMTADLAEVKPALAAYRSAFLRVEKALAAYQAVATASVLGRDRPTEAVVNYMNFDQASRQDLTKILDLGMLNVSNSRTAAEIRADVAAARQDILGCEHHAAAYRAARKDLLLAWEDVARLYPQFNSFDGATRRDWTDAWTQQQAASADSPLSLKVPAPDFTGLDVGPWTWVFNYQDGNPMLSAFSRLEDLPVPDLESLDDVLSVLAAVDQARQNSTAWSQLLATQVVPLLQQWLDAQLAWARKRPANWQEKFGGWAAGQIAFARDDILMSHAFAKGDPAAPVITQQPAGVKVGRGQSTVLSVGVQGTLYACDWYLYIPQTSGPPLLQACPANFGPTFRTPPISTDTQFVCKLRWGVAPDANNKILYSDVITVSVDDGTNQSFNPVSLSVPKTGGTYGVTLTSTGTNGALPWTSATSASWVAVPAAGPGSGSVSVVVEPNTTLARSARVTIGNATLNVYQASSIDPPAGAPVFTLQPANQTAAVTGGASFTAAATGTTPITYQWKKGALNLINGGRIAGATSATLLLTNVQASDAGKYSVVATNSVGSTVSGVATLTVTPPAGAPANDGFAAAAILTGASATTSASSAGATRETNEPRHYGATGGSSVWWRWTAPGTGPVVVDTVGSNLDTLLAVYTGSAVGALMPVVADDQSGGGGSSAVRFNAASGTTYAIAVDGAAGSTGTVQLHLAQATAPANDNFVDAALISGNSGSVAGSNLAASGETNEPYHVTAAGAASSIWYRWTATAAGSLTVDTIGSSFDTVLAAYSGTGLSALTKLASDDGSGGTGSTSRVSFNVAAGTTYHIAVGSFGPTRGNVSLNWQYSMAPAGTLVPTITTQPQPQAVLAGTNATFSVVADGTAPLTYQWKKDGLALAGSTHLVGVSTATLKVVNVQAADAGLYQVVVSNAAGEAPSIGAALALNPGGGASPTVSITAPASGAGFAIGSSTTVSAIAADSDGTVTSVKFAASGVELGTDTTPPYSATWTAAGPGAYALTAIATDNSGNHTVSTITVSAGLPAAITQQPQGQSVALGANASFSVVGSGTALSYQWFKNGVSLPIGTTATLTLTNVQATDAGTYEVVVDNAYGPPVTSTVATLNVTGVPSGYGANFDALTAGATLDAQGSPPWAAIKLPYYVDPQVIAGDTAHATNHIRGPVGSQMSGASQSVLPPLVYPQGNYRAEWTCQIAVPAPSAGNTISALTMSGPTGTGSQGVLFGARGFTASPPTGFTAGAVVLCIDDALGALHAGSTLTGGAWYELKLVVDFRNASGRGSLSYRNLTAGETVFTPDTLLQDVDLKLTATSAQYTFNTAAVLVFNGSKIDTLSASPAMPIVPTIMTQPVSQSVAAGATLSFSVAAQGISIPLTYQWRKNGVALVDGAPTGGATISGAATPTLILTGVQPADAGNYVCQISDSAGAVTSNVATLKVTSATDPVVTGYALMKQRLMEQFSSAGPTQPSSPPLSFEVRVGGSHLLGLNAPSFVSPAGSVINGGTLIYDESIKRWRFSSASPYANLTGTAPTLNGDFADGAYTLTLAGTPVTLGVQPMPTTTFPDSPRITGGTWVNGALQVDASRDYTLTFEPFANAAPGSVIWLRLHGTGMSGDVSLETANAATTSFVIPANTLTPGGVYSAHLVFLNATSRDTTAIAGATGVGGYAARLNFAIAANGAVPVFSGAPSASGTVGAAFTYAATASNSPGSYALSGLLPLGLSLNSTTGAITGTPLVAGAYGVTIIATNSAGQSLPFALSIAIAPAAAGPANDTFADRATLAGLPATATAANGGATKETGEPNHVGAGGASVWWTWTAPSSGTVTIDTAGSSFDTQLAVYTGTSLAALTPVAANDDGGPAGTSAVSFSALAGTSYQIAVDGFGGATGAVALHVTAAMIPAITSPGSVSARVATFFNFQVTASNGPTSFAATGLPPGLNLAAATGIISGMPTTADTYPVSVTAGNAAGTSPATTLTITVSAGTTTAPTIATQPLSQSVGAGGNATFTVAAAGTPAPAYRWQFSIDGGNTWSDVTDAAPYAGATTATLTVSAVSAAQSRLQFRCAVSNTAGAVFTNPAMLRVAPTVSPFAGADDFATAGYWSAPILSGPGPRLDRTNGRLEYTVGTATPDDRALREWTANVGSYTQSWAVQVDVHLASLNLATGQYANLNLVVLNGADALKPFEQADAMCVAIDRYGNGTTTVHNFEGDLVGNGTRIPTTGMIEVVNSSTDAALRISFDASSKQLTSWYDADGAANGYAWTQLQSVNIGGGAYTWDMTDSSTFAVMLVGGSGGVALSSGQAYFDNFAAGSDGGATVPVITSPASAPGTMSSGFSYAIVATNSPTSFALTGTLPAGMIFNPTTGIISGTPTAIGTYPVTVTATNAAGTSAAATLTITVSAPGGTWSYDFASSGINPNHWSTVNNSGTFTFTHAPGTGVVVAGGNGSFQTGKLRLDLSKFSAIGDFSMTAVFTGSQLSGGVHQIQLETNWSGGGVLVDRSNQSSEGVAGGNSVNIYDGTHVLGLTPVAAAGGTTTPGFFTLTRSGTVFTAYWNGVPFWSGSYSSNPLTDVFLALNDNYGATDATQVTWQSFSLTAPAISVVPPGTTASHAVAGGYHAGTTVTVSNTIVYPGTATALTWHVLLPDGWSYVGSAGAVGATQPAAGATSVLDWTWTTVPASPVAFTYTLNVPASAAGAANLIATGTLTQGGVGVQVLAAPDPLPVAPSTAHRADTDRNFRISLVELTRVIELYNTRNGTLRTGAYKVQDGTEDGFAPEPTRASGATVTLTRYHSADTAVSGPRDARIDLVELTRVIELYNYRSGTVRTGEYHVQASPVTEDGFAAGP